MTFRHGRVAELYVGGFDVSPFFHFVTLTTKVATVDVSVFKTLWKQYLTGDLSSTLVADGFYDPTRQEVKALLQTIGAVVTYHPAGGVAVGDLARLILGDLTDYRETSPRGGAVATNFSAISDQAIGWGVCLSPLAAQATNGSTTGWDPLNQGIQTTTGAVVHVHVTAMTGGDSLVFTLKDATSSGGAGALAVAGGAITVTAVGGYRLVIPGTIRAYLQMAWTGFTHPATFAYSAART